MMQKCKMCGMCCKVILLKRAKTEIRKMDGNVRNKEVILKHWKCISRAKAIELNKYLKLALDKSKTKYYYYTCLLLGADNKCTIHDSKPPVCERFPLYDNYTDELTLAEAKKRLVSKECGYWPKKNNTKGKEAVMAKDQAGERKGTGPYKGSDQAKTSQVGKRQQRGEPCPKKK